MSGEEGETKDPDYIDQIREAETTRTGKQQARQRILNTMTPRTSQQKPPLTCTGEGHTQQI
eukprot:5394929-Prorocentrum_lima.AAC.1